ncbi:hypothetical protein JCM19296_1499 [Nonlabens ulvanivorans]|uniref:Phophatidylinositol-4-phosphate 5-kinase n=1 Tax=Nonlabens ulvanivorans TaxID=906888 RepID=A0A081DAF6_NONUL|nr:hypothetical protein [Nonlabens ulvanivorans]GAK75902.1 hypothetical protein JCM19296_1499 [Nonlabens ulvanivorans]
MAHLVSCAQNENNLDPKESEMISIDDTTTKPPKAGMVSMDDASVTYGGVYGQQYFKKGNKKPYTGWLCARYDNGKLESAQQFVNGIGNGVWINYNPDGSKESQGTYVNNKTEGPAKLFYENGSLKAAGNYIHLKRKVGWWYFYDREGTVVSKRYFTR